MILMTESYPKINEMNYFTNRKLENEAGEKTGRLLMYRIKGREEFEVKMTCPFCGAQQKQSIVFEKRPYRMKCKECEKIIKVPKLKK